MVIKASEKGQALILITFAAIALFGFAALAIDGTRVYSEKRHAQNAADTAALAGALAYTRNNSHTNLAITAAQTRATSNGYDDNGTSNDVTISLTDVPSGDCPGGTQGKDVTVTIVSVLDTTFARVIGRNQVTTAVTATSRACGYYEAPLFNGDAIVSLRPNDGGDCGIDSGTGDWVVSGGGVYSNGCATAKKLFILDEDDCLTSVVAADPDEFPDVECLQTESQSINMTQVDAMMPTNPCTGAITSGRYAGGGKVATSGQLTFDNDIFCLDDIDYFDDENVYVNNATLYVTDMSFDIKFPGNDGGFSGTATQGGTYTGSEEYDGYFMVIARNTASPCTSFQHGPQTIVLRGNVGDNITGTIFAPSSCIDLRGTSDGEAMQSQVIGYMVTSNGDATLTVDYDVDDNHEDPVNPTISVLE
jgi:Flp pilus assembly protein TadG